MHDDRSLSWLPTICRASSGLPYVLAMLAAAFPVPQHCLAQSAPGAGTNAASTGAAWVPTGRLNVARDGHTATLLPNGKVLVVGGANNDADLSRSAELYDPATGTWSVTGRPNAAHWYHTATLLPDGRVLIVGGTHNAISLDSAELYDSSTGTWSSTGNATTIRGGHTATLLKNGKVLVAGGDNVGIMNGIMKSATLFDPATSMWSSTGSLMTQRTFHQATLLQDGKVLVMGGTAAGDYSEDLSSVEIYDPTVGSWSNTASMIFERTEFTATPLSSGMVLVAGGGGFVTELFDPTARRRWSEAGRLNTRRIAHTATLLPDGKVLAAGGALPYSSTVVVLDSAEQFDGSTGKWEYAGNLNAGRQGHTATLLANGNVLVAGGYGADGVLDSAELYGSAGVIGAGFTGSWFNPAQNGHGFALEVLPGQPKQLLASWFTFAPQGGPAWIVGLGPVNGNQAVLQGYQSSGSGGRFPPNFDAANVHQETWGTLTFTFSDCNHGRVDWVATAPGYGSGGMDLTRLTLPAGLSCQ